MDGEVNASIPMKLMLVHIANVTMNAGDSIVTAFMVWFGCQVIMKMMGAVIGDGFFTSQKSFVSLRHKGTQSRLCVVRDSSCLQ